MEAETSALWSGVTTEGNGRACVTLNGVEKTLKQSADRLDLTGVR